MSDYIKVFAIVLVTISLIVFCGVGLVVAVFGVAYYLEAVTGIPSILFFLAAIIVGFSVAITIAAVREERQK